MLEVRLGDEITRVPDDEDGAVGPTEEAHVPRRGPVERERVNVVAKVLRRSGAPAHAHRRRRCMRRGRRLRLVRARVSLERAECVAEHAVARTLVREVHHERLARRVKVFEPLALALARRGASRGGRGALVFGDRRVPVVDTGGRHRDGFGVSADGQVVELEGLGLDEVEEKAREHSRLEPALGDLRPVHPVVLEAADVEDGEDHERQGHRAADLGLGLHQEHRQGHDANDEEDDDEVELDGVGVLVHVPFLLCRRALSADRRDDGVRRAASAFEGIARVWSTRWPSRRRGAAR